MIARCLAGTLLGFPLAALLLALLLYVLPAHGEAFFELLQACRVGVEVVKEAIQLAHGFFDLDLRAGH